MGSPKLRNGRDERLSVLERPGRDGDEDRDLLAVPLLRDHRQRRRGRQVDDARDLVGRIVATSRGKRAGGPARLGGIEDRPGVDRRGRAGAASSSNCVTIPKLPPPPRSPHSRSAFSVSLARTSRPSAVTTSAATRLSQARPNFRIVQPMPPPSVKPATPVEETRPPVVARPWACVSWSTSAQTAPPPTVARRACGVDPDAVHRPEVDHDAVVARREARRCCGRRRGRRSAGRCCGRSRQPRSRRPRPCSGRSSAGRAVVVLAVPDAARLVVAVVSGATTSPRTASRSSWIVASPSVGASV